MKDLFTDYKKQHSKKTFAIITASFVFALSLNAFLFGTDTGARLQTSVLNSTGKIQENEKADLLIESAGTGTDLLKLITSKKLNGVSKMYFSLAFDPEVISVNDIFSESNKNMEVVKNSNVPGIVSLTFLFKAPETIQENTEIAKIAYKKKGAEKTVLNLAETQFKSADGTIYELSNSPIEF